MSPYPSTPGRSRQTDRIPSRSLEINPRRPSVHGPRARNAVAPPIRGAIAGRERFCGREGPSRLRFRCRDSRGVGRVSADVPAQNRRIVGPMPGVEHTSGSRSGDSRPVSGNPASRGRRSTCPPGRLADRDQAVTVSRRICARHRHVRRWTLREPGRCERSRCLARGRRRLSRGPRSVPAEAEPLPSASAGPEPRTGG